jgi:hypothetical protein
MNHLQNPGVDGKIILKRIFRGWMGGIDWVDLAEDTDRWPAFVSMEMNLRVP